MISRTLARPDLTIGALLGALVLAVSLAGCGRIGALDLPPGATTDYAPNGPRAKPAPTEPGANAVGTTDAPLLGSGTPTTAVAAPAGQKRPLPIDWLLN